MIEKEIDSKIEEYERDSNKDESRYLKDDKAINRVFKKYPTNTIFEEVLAKVCIINTLYSAGVRENQVRKLAEHIINIASLDEKIRKGDLEAFNSISNTPKDMNNVPVFASKYCHFSNPQKFVIYDSNSRRALVNLNNKLHFADTFTENAITDYQKYKKNLDLFLGRLQKAYSYKKIDEFLWLYGKKP